MAPEHDCESPERQYRSPEHIENNPTHVSLEREFAELEPTTAAMRVSQILSLIAEALSPLPAGEGSGVRDSPGRDLTRESSTGNCSVSQQILHKPALSVSREAQKRVPHPFPLPRCRGHPLSPESDSHDVDGELKTQRSNWEFKTSSA